jgi:hypothetical protein
MTVSATTRVRTATKVRRVRKSGPTALQTRQAAVLLRYRPGCIIEQMF